MSTERDKITEFITNVPIQTNREADAQVLNKLIDNFDQAQLESRSASQKNIWRVIMHSKITKLTASAAVLVIILVGATQLINSRPAFADVIKPIFNARTIVYSCIVGDEETAPVVRDMVMGSRIRRWTNDSRSVWLYDLETSKAFALVPALKSAVCIDLKCRPNGMYNPMEKLRNSIVTLQNDPRYEIKECGTHTTLEGQEVLRFHALTKDKEITIWADPVTALPVRIETQVGQMHVIYKDIQFDVTIDESLFSMDVPEGYTLQETELDLDGATEQDFIEGLRVWAEEILDGEFPASVSLEDHLKQIPIMEEKLFRQRNLSNEEMLAIGMKINRYSMFISSFKGEGKWHYAGEGVKLGDADKAIFWYRPKGSDTYRVIFGDLHVEDRTAKNLPQAPPSEP